MSEIELCPVCGKEGGIIEYPDDMGSGWFCGDGGCSFSCSPEDLPRISAAMELARAEVAMSRTTTEDANIGARNSVFAAVKRVLEVFK